MTIVNTTNPLEVIYNKYKNANIQFKMHCEIYDGQEYKSYELEPNQEIVDDIEMEIKNLHYRSVMFIPPGGMAILNFDPTRVKVWFKEENSSVVIDSIIAG